MSTTGFGASGYAFTLGVGHDWRISRWLSVTAFGNLLYMPEAPVIYTLRMGGNLIQAGVGVTWR